MKLKERFFKLKLNFLLGAVQLKKKYEAVARALLIWRAKNIDGLSFNTVILHK